MLRFWAAMAVVATTASPAPARPAAIGERPLIGLGRAALVAELQRLGWTCAPVEGAYVVKAVSIEDDATTVFAHLDRRGKVVGVSILVGKEEGTFVRDHLAALERWCRGRESRIPVDVERDDDGDGIAEVDVGTYTHPTTGLP